MPARESAILTGNLPPGVDADEYGKPNGILIEAKGLMAVVPALPDLVNLTMEKL